MLMMKATIIVLTTVDCILFSFLSEGLTAWKSATDTAADEYRIVFRVCLVAEDDNLAVDGRCRLQTVGDITTRGGENPLVHMNMSAAPKSNPLNLAFMLIITILLLAIIDQCRNLFVFLLPSTNSLAR
mmetsp:Transcript_21151/g.33195  ORF Transcript_21151/g.33195 Transcript_21151/m.33195 type:complete len:128 (-) Transcript_21151:11-394(-)